MKVLITAVGHRTEHWTDLFAILCRRPDLELTIAVADVSARTADTLAGFAREFPRLRYLHLPHLLTEVSTGHMASVLFHPRARAALTRHRPDVLHIIGEAAYLSTWQLLRWRDRYLRGTPVTLYAAQNVVMRFPIPFPWLEKRAYTGVNHTFPITPAARDVLRTKGYRGDATIVPLGVDTTLFTPGTETPPPGRFTVGFVGRLEPHKGIGDLLAAVRELDCDLLVVGKGSLSADVHTEAARRPDRITVREWVDHHELPGLLRRMDVLVLPSAGVVQRNVVPWIGIALREQFGRVLVEAMACGVPVIGSDVGEIPHVIGAAGMTFPAGDVPALVDRISQLRDDPVLAQRLSVEATGRARSEFGWDRSADRLTEVWRSLTTSPRASSPLTTSPLSSNVEKAGKVSTS